MNNSNPSDPPIDDTSLKAQGFDDLAMHWTHPAPQPPRLVPTNEDALPTYLDRSAATTAPRATNASVVPPPHRGILPNEERGPSFHQERFSSDPRDDVLLKWADGEQPWWHFDVEARMVDRETLWITEKLEELFVKYLKPVWWGRFVEGLNDFFGMVFHELIRPVWSLFAVPLAVLAELLPDIDWPCNVCRIQHQVCARTHLRQPASTPAPCCRRMCRDNA